MDETARRHLSTLDRRADRLITLLTAPVNYRFFRAERFENPETREGRRDRGWLLFKNCSSTL